MPAALIFSRGLVLAEAAPTTPATDHNTNVSTSEVVDALKDARGELDGEAPGRRGSFPTTSPAHLPPLTSNNTTRGSAVTRPKHPLRPREPELGTPPADSLPPSGTTTPNYPRCLSRRKRH
jgi:hypothetical protein